jgi:hypothetical protein
MERAQGPIAQKTRRHRRTKLHGRNQMTAFQPECQAAPSASFFRWQIPENHGAKGGACRGAFGRDFAAIASLEDKARTVRWRGTPTAKISHAAQRLARSC